MSHIDSSMRRGSQSNTIEISIPGSRCAFARALSSAFSTKLSKSVPGMSTSSAIAGFRTTSDPARRRSRSLHHVRAAIGMSWVAISGARSFSSVALRRLVSCGSWLCSNPP